MANLASTAVTVLSSWTDGQLALKKYVVYHVTLVLTAQGTVANAITAAALGLGTIVRASTFVKSDNTVVLPAGPSNDGTLLLLGGGAANAPADYTGTFTGTVWGHH